MKVEETAFKLFRWDNLVLTCAGDVAPIREFVRLTDYWLGKGLMPWLALAHARKTQEVRSTESFEAVAATRIFGDVRLLRLDLAGGWHWVQRDAAVNLGSASQKSRDFVNGAIGDTVKADQPATMQLASVLAACQSLTVHNDLLSEGVGGAFSGVMIDAKGSRWQPDMGYLLLNPPDMRAVDHKLEVETRNTSYITCAVRDDVLFVSSPEVEGTTAFLSTKQNLSAEVMTSVVRQAFGAARSVRANCSFQFVAVVSKTWPQTALVQMHERRASNDLQLDFEKIGETEKLTVLMSERVGDIVRGKRDEPWRPRVYICLNEAPAGLSPHPSSAPR